MPKLVRKSKEVHEHTFKKGIIKERISYGTAHNNFRERKPRTFKIRYCATCAYKVVLDFE